MTFHEFLIPVLPVIFGFYHFIGWIPCSLTFLYDEGVKAFIYQMHIIFQCAVDTSISTLTVWIFVYKFLNSGHVPMEVAILITEVYYSWIMLTLILDRATQTTDVRSIRIHVSWFQHARTNQWSRAPQKTGGGGSFLTRDKHVRNSVIYLRNDCAIITYRNELMWSKRNCCAREEMKSSIQYSKLH